MKPTKKQLFDLFDEILKNGNKIRTSVRGNSMLHLIDSKDYVIINPLQNKILIGDILVFNDDYSLIAHRVVSKKKNGLLVTKGDSNIYIDPLLKESDILGKVIIVEKKNGNRINLECETWRILNYIIAICSFLIGVTFEKLYLIKCTLVGKKNNYIIKLFSKLFQFLLSFPIQIIYKIYLLYTKFRTVFLK